MVPTRVENGIHLGWPTYSLGLTAVFIAAEQGVHRVPSLAHRGWPLYSSRLTVILIRGVLYSPGLKIVFIWAGRDIH